MKIVFAGGGTGGHFYPLIAVAEEILKIVEEKRLIKPEMFFLSNTPYDEAALAQHGITYKHVSAGKVRRYFSVRNGLDFFKTLVGLPTALNILFKIYPDVVFSKGGYTSVPVVLAARLLRIPVFVHDSDAIPGVTLRQLSTFHIRKMWRMLEILFEKVLPCLKYKGHMSILHSHPQYPLS
jgi:UDP-N-acetylglucosamine--N-acetylmuramyl-(pentapeptide) pyrophosphoryl-undecaprenol N-acetylglucosamine transferase